MKRVWRSLRSRALAASGNRLLQHFCPCLAQQPQHDTDGLGTTSTSPVDPFKDSFNLATWSPCDQFRNVRSNWLLSLPYYNDIKTWNSAKENKNELFNTLAKLTEMTSNRERERERERERFFRDSAMNGIEDVNDLMNNVQIYMCVQPFCFRCCSRVYYWDGDC